MSEWLSSSAAPTSALRYGGQVAASAGHLAAARDEHTPRAEADEGARLESEMGERHRALPKLLKAYAIRDLIFENYLSMSAVNLDVLRGFEPDVSQSYHNRDFHLATRQETTSAVGRLLLAVVPHFERIRFLYLARQEGQAGGKLADWLNQPRRHTGV